MTQFWYHSNLKPRYWKRYPLRIKAWIEWWPTQDSGYFGLVLTLASDGWRHSARDATLWPCLIPENPWCHLQTRTSHSKRQSLTYLTCLGKIMLCTQTSTLAGNGEPPFDSLEYNSFLQDCGVKKCISSVHYPQSNSRTELAVKTVKRTLMNCIDGYGHLNHDRAARAMMTHKNIPHQNHGLSSAEMYGRAMIQIYKRWRKTKELRERVIAKRQLLN